MHHKIFNNGIASKPQGSAKKLCDNNKEDDERFSIQNYFILYESMHKGNMQLKIFTNISLNYKKKLKRYIGTYSKKVIHSHHLKKDTLLDNNEPI